jgi:hypothetical protein
VSKLISEDELRSLSRIRPIADCPKQDTDGPTFSSLGERIEKSNPKIQAIVEEVRRARQGGGKLHKAVMICAPAGSGKSTLFRHIDATLPDLSYLVGLDRLRERTAIKTVMAPDLRPDDGAEDGIFSHLPQFDPIESAPEFVDLMKSFNIDYLSSPRPLIIVDSIDEIHPDSSKRLLDKIDHFVAAEKRKNPSGVLCVLVVGRPEGFREYYIDPHFTKKPPPVELSLPGYASRADLRMAAAQIADSNNRGEEAVNAFLRLADKYPLVCESAYDLALLAELVKNAVDFEMRGLSERDIGDHLFNFLLARNSRTHHRPDHRNQDYIRLLEQVAAIYSQKTKYDLQGYFIVDSEQAATINRSNPDKPNCSYLIVDVLSRSGIAYLSPADLYNPTFRFFPSWVHQHLARLYNEAMDPSLTRQNSSQKGTQRAGHEASKGYEH